MIYVALFYVSSFLNQQSGILCPDDLVTIEYINGQISNLTEFSHILIVPVRHVNDYQYSHVTEFLDDGYYFKELALLFVTNSRHYLIKKYEGYYKNSKSIFIDDVGDYYQNMCYSAHPVYVRLNEKKEIVKIEELTNDRIYPIKSSLIRGLKRVNFR
jgi:hypothetical protein